MIARKNCKLNLKLRKLYWLIGRHSELDLTCKRILYVAIIKPIWTYGIQQWAVPVSPILRLSNAAKTLLSVLLSQHTVGTIEITLFTEI